MDSNQMENDFVNYTSHLFNERPYVDDSQGNVTDTSEESRLISTLDIDQAERRKNENVSIALQFSIITRLIIF